MKVAELAEQLGLDAQDILDKLKSLRLKAKGPNQELNTVVETVLKNEFEGAVKEKKEQKKASKKEEQPSAQEEEGAPAAEDKTVKKSVKKTTKKKVAEKPKTAVKKPAEKKTVKKTVKKTTAKKTEDKPKKKKSAEEKKKAPLKLKTTIIRRPKTKTPQQRAGKEAASPVPEEQKDKEPQKTDKLAAVPRPQPTKAGTPPEAEKRYPPAKAETLPVEKAAAETRGELEVRVPIAVKDLAVKLQEKPSVILKKLMQMGLMAHINQNLSEEIVSRILKEFGYSLAKVKTQEESIIEQHDLQREDASQLKTRAPVVTFMGHVDHGKTTLLDQIRKSKIVDQEHGGITQHMGAYSVKVAKGSISFLDTPGHEAFTAMRARGAHITDLVVLVIAADEGVMPQTDEAIDHARAAKVPIVVALNKIDKASADPDLVKKQLMERGLVPEDWGGKTIVSPVSAVSGEGVDHLLEMILLEAELLELRANPGKKASGIVVEAQLTHGRGPVATILIQNGTLQEGDALIVGPCYAKVKAMFNDRQKPVKEAGPSSAVEILGLSGVPEAGEIFYVVEDEKTARDVAGKREQKAKDVKLQTSQKITLEDVYSQIQEGRIKELNIILKADVQGSVGALQDSLLKLSTDEVKLNFIHTGVGVVNASDVILAGASNAVIIAFNVGLGPRAKEELEKIQIDVREYRIIYDAINDMKKALEGMLEPRKKKIFTGRAEVRDVFKLSKAGSVAGCFVTKGKLARRANIDVLRNGESVHSGRISTLKRFKDDVREVSEGYECGITVEGFNDYQVGDIFEAYEIETIARTL